MVEKPQVNFQALINEMVKRIDDNTRRIKTIEQRLDGMSLRIEALENKMIEDVEDMKKRLDQLSLDVKSIAESLLKIRVETRRLNKDLEKTARKSEIKELESLLDLYSPIKSKFVTREEVERLIEEKVGKKV